MGDLPRGTVTFLFTDLEGSTQLLRRLGAEEYAEVLDRHRRVIRSAVSRSGGVEVDSSGDAFFAAFPTAPGALEAAADITESLEGTQVRVRIGLHTGTPLVTREGYVGGDVHRAARIAAAGSGGQVLVSSSTAMLVEGDLRDLGEHRFKDMPGPERVFQLGHGTFPPLKSLRRSAAPPKPAGASLFGRTEELSAVGALLEDAQEGPAALVLTGEPGVGKTALWRAGLDRARARSFRVLTCFPVESEATLSFTGLGDLFGEVLDELDVSLPAPQARALDVALLRAEPEGPPPDSHAVSLAVLGLVRLLSGSGPLIIAMDDVQWLDPSSARVLEFAVRRLELEPVGILVTARTGEGSPDPLGLERAFPAGAARNLSVGPMGVDDLGRLVRSRLSSPLRLPALVRLHEMSGGNPFFALEIARAAEHGDMPATGEVFPVPHSLRELIRERIAALTEDDRSVLLVAAALSDRSLAAVEAAADVKDPAASLRRSADAGLIEIDGHRVRFVHPMFGSAIRSEASAASLMAVHRRLADFSTDPEERARHLALGAHEPDSAVAAALDEAARSSRARGAPDAAAELCEMAARLTPPDLAEERLERTLEAARHHVEAGDALHGRAIVQAAIEHSAPGPLRARALLFLGLSSPAGGSWTTALEVLEQALREAGDDDALRGKIEQGLGYSRMFRGDLNAAVPHAEAALALAERAGDAGPIAEALQFVAYLEFCLGGGVLEDLLDRAVTLERDAEEYWVWDPTRPTHTAAQLLKYTGRFDEARAAFHGLMQRAVERGRVHQFSGFQYHIAELECWAGNWDAAGEHARRSLEATVQMGETAHYRTAALYASALVGAHFGHTEAARAAATEGLEIARTFDVMSAQILNLSVLGFVKLFDGDPAAALAHLSTAHDLSAQMGVVEPALQRFLPDEVEALVALGELGRAEAALDPFLERAAALDRAWALATGGRCRGLLLAAGGDLPGALAAMREAVTVHDRVPEPFALGRTLLSLGRVQRRARQKAEARTSFEQASTIFSQLGAGPWAELAAGEARRVGLRAPDAFELTATEQRIVAMVAEGSTNKETADALFISVNTVEWNLSRIYRKLGIRSRTELAAKLREGP